MRAIGADDAPRGQEVGKRSVRGQAKRRPRCKQCVFNMTPLRSWIPDSGSAPLRVGNRPVTAGRPVLGSEGCGDPPSRGTRGGRRAGKATRASRPTAAPIRQPQHSRRRDRRRCRRNLGRWLRLQRFAGQRRLVTRPIGAISGIAAAHGFVWAADNGSGLLTQVDPAGHIIRQISVGAQSANSREQVYGITGIAACRNSLWLTDPGGDRVWNLDPASTRIADAVAVAGHPTGIACDGRDIWVTSTATTPSARSIRPPPASPGQSASTAHRRGSQPTRKTSGCQSTEAPRLTIAAESRSIDSVRAI